jgi:ligand-binding sensor domain-containing protein
VDHAGTLWVGTVEGVFIFDGSTFTSFELPEGTPDPNKGVTSSRIVWRIMEDGRSRLWFVGEGCVFTYDVDAVSRVPVMDEESVTYVSSILEDQTGNLWFASSKGLFRSEGGAFVNVTERAGLSGGVGGMCEDRHGNIWFAVQGSGVYRYDGVSLTHFSEKGRSGRWPGRDLVRRLDGGVPIRRRVVRQRDPRRPVVGPPKQHEEAIREAPQPKGTT